MDAMSCCKSEIAFSIRVLMLAATSLTELNDGPLGAAASVFIMRCLRRLMNHSADGLAHRHTHYIACYIQIENQDGQLVVPAHGDRSGVHHSEPFRKHFQVGDFRVLDGLSELQRVHVVNAIHPRPLGDHVGLDLKRAQRGRRVGGEVGIGCAGREDHDAAFFQMANGAAPDIRLGHLVHFDGAHHAGGNAHLLQASESARELMTVASMPMWSPVTRSMLRAAAATPRKMLPPPTTTPISTPAAVTSATSRARAFTRSASIPKVAVSAKASPLSLSRMRL